MPTASSQFETLLSGYFEKLLEDVPTFAAAYAGLRSGEGKLGRAGIDFHRNRERARRHALRSLENISPLELTNEQQIDRLALRAQLLKESEDYARGRHTLEPNAPEQLLNILLHELLRGDDVPKRAAENLRSLLRAAPDFLEEASNVIQKPEKVWLRTMQQTVSGGPILLEAVGKFLAAKASYSEDAGRIRSTQRALDRYAKKVKERPLAPAGSFAIGSLALQRRVHDELGLDYTLGQVEAVALGEVNRVTKLLRETAGRLGRKDSPDKLIAEWRSQWRPQKPLLELYQEETRRVAENFRKAKAVSFPKGDELQIKPVPEFLRQLIPTAAYTDRKSVV